MDYNKLLDSLPISRSKLYEKDYVDNLLLFYNCIPTNVKKLNPVKRIDEFIENRKKIEPVITLL